MEQNVTFQVCNYKKHLKFQQNSRPKITTTAHFHQCDHTVQARIGPQCFPIAPKRPDLFHLRIARARIDATCATTIISTAWYVYASSAYGVYCSPTELN